MYRRIEPRFGPVGQISSLVRARNGGKGKRRTIFGASTGVTKVHPSFHFISRGSILGTAGARVEIEVSTSSSSLPIFIDDFTPVHSSLELANPIARVDAASKCHRRWYRTSAVFSFQFSPILTKSIAFVYRFKFTRETIQILQFWGSLNLTSESYFVYLSTKHVPVKIIYIYIGKRCRWFETKSIISCREQAGAARGDNHTATRGDAIEPGQRG